MIKLIASDVDGTILQDEMLSPSNEILELIKLCKSKGITFAIASGRQYPNLKRMFYSVFEDLLFIAENGGVVVKNDKVLYTSEISKQIGINLINDIMTTEHNEILLCCKDCCYISPKNKSFLNLVAETFGYTLSVFKKPEDIVEPWIKITAYLENYDSHNYIEKYKKRWGDIFNVVVSGKEWIDFGICSKGDAIRFLADSNKFTPDEMVAIGDNGNDVSMFNAVTHSFVMENSADEVKSHAKYIIKNAEEAIKQILSVK